MKKAYKYRIYPTKKQADLLNEQLALYADLYNAALQERRDAYKLCGKIITFTQQESRRLVDRFGLIAVEALVVRTLVQRPSPKQDEETGRYVPNGASAKSGLNKSIAVAAWSAFFSALFAKVEETGRTVIKVPPAYTTQTCHDCGYRQE